MKRAKSTNKVPRLFKLPPKLDVALRRESKRTNINQTRIVEMALENLFKLKRA